MTHSAPTAAQETEGLPRDTCLQCEQTRAEVKANETICGIEGGYEYRELEAEWPRHHWRDWSDVELSLINPEYRDLYRRATISTLGYAPCEHRTRGHSPARGTDHEYGLIAGHCIDCGHDTTEAMTV
jgi:hypothetical protein